MKNTGAKPPPSVRKLVVFSREGAARTQLAHIGRARSDANGGIPVLAAARCMTAPS
jgi:hypothetical protein